jgi:hypothetical protein
MDEIIVRWKNNARKNESRTKLFLKRIPQKEAGKIDALVDELHEEAFEKIDCLQCANCCKTISPTLKKPDIERISKHLRMKESAFIDRYLHLDEDNDFVVKSLPCPFLGADNYCSIYEVRPRDCRDYPHSDKAGFLQKANLHTKNTVSCPAVFYIFEKLKEKLNFEN